MIWKYVPFRLPELVNVEHLIPVVKFAREIELQIENLEAIT